MPQTKPANRKEWEQARQQDDAGYALLFANKPPRYYQRLHPKSHWKRMTLPVVVVLCLIGLAVFAGVQSDIALLLTAVALIVLSLLVVWFIRLRSLWIYDEHRLEVDPVSGQVYQHQWGSKKLFVSDSAPDLKSLRRYDVDTWRRTIPEQYIWPFKGSQTLVLTPVGSEPPKRTTWFDRYILDKKPVQSTALVIRDVVDAELIVEIAQWHDAQTITMQQRTMLEQMENNTHASESVRLLRKIAGEPPIEDTHSSPGASERSGRWNSVRGQYRHR